MLRTFSLTMTALALVACGGNRTSDASPAVGTPSTARQLTLTYFTMKG